MEPRDTNGSIARNQRIFLLGASPSLTNGQMTTDEADLVKLSAEEKLTRSGGNSGNQVIAYGLLKTISFEAVSWDYSIGPARANDEYDLLLIAAANFLHEGFDFGHMASFIEATKLPCIMVGVGAQSSDYSTDIRLKPGTDRLMRVVSERSNLIGVRGAFTADVLNKMGIRNLQVTGCPSYYMNCKPSLEIRKPPLHPHARLLINSSRDVVSHSFDRERMISVVCQLLALAIERNADFVPQSELPEISISETRDPEVVQRYIKQILDAFPFYESVADRTIMDQWFNRHMRALWDVPNWYREMKNYDFVLGNRFHGNMMALQAGTPACVICHDTRTTEMCEFFGLPFVGLQNIDRVDVADLYSLVDPAAINSRYQFLYRQYKQFLQDNKLDAVLE